MQNALENSQTITWMAASLPVAIAVALIAHLVIFRILKRIAKRTEGLPDDSFTRHCAQPARWTLILIALRIVLPLLGLPENIVQSLIHILAVTLIASVAWLIIKLTFVLDDYILNRFDVAAKDNLQARKIHTQLRVVRRIVMVIVCILAFASILMTFEKVRQLGTTILASAGIIGIVVGMAAQKTIGTFIAGLQIAITQPIRIDDVVIVENEWGRIEEITLTYVVVRIWDLRRLIVPITYFIEKPFQNWTRVTADLLAPVFIYVDYTVPIDAVREELKRILDSSQYWDKKVCVLQVTNTTERAVELRALASAADAPTAWNLRCEVREKLVEFVRDNYPGALPRFRGELERPKDL